MTSRLAALDGLTLRPVHPEHGVPSRVEPAEDGALRCFFASESGELVAERRGGRWGAAVPADPDAAPAGPARSRERAGGAALRRLVRLFDDAGGEVLVDRMGSRFVCAPVGDRFAVLDGDGLRSWLAAEAARRGDLPGEAAVRGGAFAIVARDARLVEVFLRVGWSQDRETIYVDLGDSSGAAVEVDAHGWRVRSSSPVYFVRPGASRALPHPVAGGDLREIIELLGVGEETGLLIIAWLLGVLAPGGPYPILVLSGPQGSGKSTCARSLKSLLDQQGAPLRSLPKDERDLAVAAGGSHVLAFDNLSTLPAGLADALCRLATGSGFASRKLYTDAGLHVLEGCRPIVLTSIGETVLGRADLADRAVSVVLPSRDRFRPDAEITAAFEVARPRLLGALLDAASAALANRSRISVDDLPRMASFAQWVMAAELGGALPWSEGEFMRLYSGNRRQVALAGIEADPLAQLIVRAVEHGEEIAGNASALFERFAPSIGPADAGFPRSAAAFGDRLRRLAPQLAVAGVEVQHRRSATSRVWIIRRREAADE